MKEEILWPQLSRHSTAQRRVDGMMINISKRKTASGIDESRMIIKLNQDIAKEIGVALRKKDPNKKGSGDRILVGIYSYTTTYEDGVEEVTNSLVIKKSNESENKSGDGFLIERMDKSGNLITSTRSTATEYMECVNKEGKERVKALFYMSRHDVENGLIYFKRSGK